MLHVTYEAVEDLEPRRLARIDEERGGLRIKLDKFESLEDVVRQLNIEMVQFLDRADWFQLWGEEILSRHTPRSPLAVWFLLECREPFGVEFREGRGVVKIYIDPILTTEQFAAVMNPAVKNLLDGGQWFQQYAGEIIDHSPEPMSRV